MKLRKADLFVVIRIWGCDSQSKPFCPVLREIKTTRYLENYCFFSILFMEQKRFPFGRKNDIRDEPDLRPVAVMLLDGLFLSQFKKYKIKILKQCGHRFYTFRNIFWVNNIIKFWPYSVYRKAVFCQFFRNLLIVPKSNDFTWNKVTRPIRPTIWLFCKV